MTLRNSARGAFRDYRGTWREDPPRTFLLAAGTLIIAGCIAAMILSAVMTVLHFT